jgi:hypothetical protein
VVPIGAGLAAVAMAIVGPPFVVFTSQPYEPPLRVGMPIEEIRPALNQSYNQLTAHGNGAPATWSVLDMGWVDCSSEPDLLGNSHRLRIYVDEGLRVKSWEIKKGSRTWPPWLDKALKWVGW